MRLVAPVFLADPYRLDADIPRLNGGVLGSGSLDALHDDVLNPTAAHFFLDDNRLKQRKIVITVNAVNGIFCIA